MKTLEKVLEIAAAVKRHGGRAMLVGGCVRDKLLGIPVKDYDLEIYGISAAQLLEAVSDICCVNAVGMSFGVLKVRHFDIDLALPRKDSKIGRGHRGFIIDTDPEMDFASASSRRDFTINAIMQDALTGEIIDEHGGISDLKNRILRHIGSSFSEDPLRVLRGMQFISRFDLTPSPETIEISSGICQDELPAERIAAEWEKMLLHGTYISKGLDFLRRCGWLKYYPALEALVSCPQNPQWHPEGSVWNHTLMVVDAAAKMRKNSSDDIIFMLAALCHDFGKAECTVTSADGRITSCGHDCLTDAAKGFITSVWQKKNLVGQVIALIERHMHPWQLVDGGSSARAYRKLALYVKRPDMLADLAEADVRGITMTQEDLKKRLACIDVFRKRCAELAIADAAPAPLVMGRHLLARNISPGPTFKKILDECFRAQIDGRFADLDGALKYLDTLLCEK